MAKPPQSTKKRSAAAAQTTVAPSQLATADHVVQLGHGGILPAPVQVATATVSGNRSIAVSHTTVAPVQVAAVNVPNIVPAPVQVASVKALASLDHAQAIALPATTLYPNLFASQRTLLPAQTAIAKGIPGAIHLQFIPAPAQVAVGFHVPVTVQPPSRVLPADTPFKLILSPLLSEATIRTLGADAVTYVDQFITFEAYNWNVDGVNWAFQYYYDRGKIDYAWWLITGNPVYRDHARAQVIDYRDGFVLPNDGAIQSHWVQLTGLALHYLETGDESSRLAVGKLADGLWAQGYQDALPTGNIDGRIKAKILESQVFAAYIDAPSVGTFPGGAPGGNNFAANAAAALNSILSCQLPDGRWYLSTWDQDLALDGSGPTQRPFMEGMLNDALIVYSKLIGPDARIVPAIKKNLDWLLANTWVESAQAFRYNTKLNVGESGVGNDQPSPVLNGLIQNGFGFINHETGIAEYKRIGDLMIGGPALNPDFLYYGKQFNQVYTGFKYFGFTNGDPAESQVIPAPVQQAFARAIATISTSKTIPAPAQQAAVTVDDPVFLASANQAIPAPAKAQTVTVTVSAAFAKTIAAPAQVATATRNATLTQSVNVPAPAQAATVAVVIHADASQTIPAPEMTADPGWWSSLYTDPPDQVATAKAIVDTGVIAQVLLPPSQIFTATTVDRFAVANQVTLMMPMAPATITVTAQAFHFGDVPLPTTSAQATVGDNLTVVAAQAVPAPAQSAEATVLVQVTVDQAIAAPASVQTFRRVGGFDHDQAIAAPAQIATVVGLSVRSAVADQLVPPPLTSVTAPPTLVLPVVTPFDEILSPLLSEATMRSLPALDGNRYMDRFAEYADIHFNLYGVDWQATDYYDRGKLYYAWYLMTGNPVYLTRARATVINYRDGYVLPNNGALADHQNQLTGLALHWLEAGDTQSRLAVGEMADHMWGYQNALARHGIDPRIKAKVLDTQVFAAYIDAPSPGANPGGYPGGNDFQANARLALTRILSSQLADGTYRSDWDQDFALDGSGPIVRAFMEGMLNDAMIMYYKLIEPDPRILPAVKQNIDALWEISWVPDAKAFRYDSKPCVGEGVGSDVPAPDLNGLLNKAFGWVFHQTGDELYRTRGDLIFQGGTGHGSLGEPYYYGTKQFNQIFTNFNYPAYAYGTAPTVPPIGTVVHATHSQTIAPPAQVATLSRRFGLFADQLVPAPAQVATATVSGTIGGVPPGHGRGNAFGHGKKIKMLIGRSEEAALEGAA
ncbi:MAG: hypothetical protein ACJ8AD_03150 [Gemmatimonadaceae bacterium]